MSKNEKEVRVMMNVQQVKPGLPHYADALCKIFRHMLGDTNPEHANTAHLAQVGRVALRHDLTDGHSTKALAALYADALAGLNEMLD
jgi:hypothetical protein